MGSKASKQDQQVDSSVSIDAVDALVNDFMKDNKINNPMIPDFIEKQIYTNCIKLVLGVLDQSLKTVNIEFLGHKLTLKLSSAQSE